MASESVTAEYSVTKWWLYFAVALFLLVPADLLMTLVAVAEHGIPVEANPVMRWLLRQGLVYVTVANLLATSLSIYLFELVTEAVGRTTGPSRRLLVRGIDAWLGFLLVAGIVLNSNSLLVLVHG